MADADVAAYLAGYGYEADGCDTWRVASNALPPLRLAIQEHVEIDGHTYYQVECELLQVVNGVQSSLHWTVKRRLSHLRTGLFDFVQARLGADVYAPLFASAPFALRGGLPGTTRRLHLWLEKLAAAVSSGTTPPAVAAQLLHFLEAPRGHVAAFS